MAATMASKVACEVTALSVITLLPPPWFCWQRAFSGRADCSIAGQCGLVGRGGRGGKLRSGPRKRPGLARARAEGTKSGKPVGKPPAPEVVKRRIVKLQRDGHSIRVIAKKVGKSPALVHKVIKARREEAAE